MTTSNCSAADLEVIRDLVQSPLCISADAYRRAVAVHFGLRPFTLDEGAALYCLLLLERQGYVYRFGRDNAGNILWASTRRARRTHRGRIEKGGCPGGCLASIEHPTIE